jgi:hypothetical protein
MRFSGSASHQRTVPALEPSADATVVQHPAEIVAQLQKTCPGWVVMWSPWRREFTGFACFTQEPEVIDEPALGQFLDHMREVEMAAIYRGPAIGGR